MDVGSCITFTASTRCTGIVCPNALMAHLIVPVCSGFLALLNHSFAGSSAREFCNFQDEPSQHSRGDQSFDLSCYSLLVVWSLSMFSFLWHKNGWMTKTPFSRFFNIYNFLPGWQKSVFHAFHCFGRCTNLFLLLCSSACSTMHVESFCRHFSHHQQKMHLLQICPWAARQLRWFYVGYAVCKGLIKVNPFWLVLYYVTLLRWRGQVMNL